MTTSEERREVAARLRESREYISGLPYVSLEQNAFNTFERILECVGYEGGNIFDYLADLIDPTCSMTCKGSFTAHHDFTRWECGECGAYAFAPKKVFAPRFCPNCGARVVNVE